MIQSSVLRVTLSLYITGSNPVGPSIIEMINMMPKKIAKKVKHVSIDEFPDIDGDKVMVQFKDKHGDVVATDNLTNIITVYVSAAQAGLSKLVR